MATKPGFLTEWPWAFLGNFKYLVLAPFVGHSIYSFFMGKEESQRDFSYIFILLYIVMRMVHHQMWISLSRYRSAKGDNRILDRSIEFDQVDRETNWDDQIILNGVVFYIGYLKFAQTHHLPLWRIDGIIITALIHTGPVEFLYYWIHRALHHHFLYSRYHSHHHSSIVTEPHTAVIHPFAEIVTYLTLFFIPLSTTIFTGTASIASIVAYAIYLDFMNLMGHCNFELIPKWTFSIFPPLKYLIYTPSFHSLHHTQFRSNYSLFMPMYDYLYGTVDKSSDTLYEKSLERKAELPDVVHLTHLTTPESIYHLRLGFASLASKPHTSKWYFWLMSPVTLWSFFITWIYGHTFVVERNLFRNLKIQTWAIPKYSIQYLMQWQRDTINNLIEEAIMEADQKGVKVLSLGLLNQEKQVNKNGELYIRRHPKLKVKVVDGSSLAVAVVLNSIPKGTSQVVLRGRFSKVAYSIALALCQGGTQVMIDGEEYKRLKALLNPEVATNLVPSKSYTSKYLMQWQRDTINNLIEEAIMEADQKGVKVLSLGLLNQEKQVNKNGELYIRRHPKLKVKVVDGSSLAVAVVLNSIPKGTSQVVLRGRFSKVAYSIALALCQGGTQVMIDGEEYKRLKALLNPEVATNVVPSKSYASKIWLVGDGLSEDEQLKAPKGTLFIPFSQFPPRKVCKDCFYFNTPAMNIPKHLENVDSCENWLPRRVMSAWRIAGILHALEGWNEHECGNKMFDIDKVWKASLRHGFSPLTTPSAVEAKA